MSLGIYSSIIKDSWEVWEQQTSCPGFMGSRCFADPLSKGAQIPEQPNSYCKQNQVDSEVYAMILPSRRRTSTNVEERPARFGNYNRSSSTWFPLQLSKSCKCRSPRLHYRKSQCIPLASKDSYFKALGPKDPII